MLKKIKIGILTGGGDCAGLNAAVKWVTKTALDRQSEKERSFQYEVVGIKDGWKGLSFTNTTELEDNVIQLNENAVRTWDQIWRYLPGYFTV